MRKTACIRLSIGILYLIGAICLPFGFLWTIPDKVSDVKLPFNKTLHDVPSFGSQYGYGELLLVLGMSLTALGAISDLSFVHCSSALAMPKKRQAFTRAIGPLCQAAASIALVCGAIVHWPCLMGLNWDGTPDREKHGRPEILFGKLATDLGRIFFQIGAVAYFLSALSAIVGLVIGIRTSRVTGKDACTLWLSLPAFVLFMAVSSMFFVSSHLPKHVAIQAAWLRFSAGVCIVIAVVILCTATFLEVSRSKKGSSALESDLFSGNALILRRESAVSMGLA